MTPQEYPHPITPPPELVLQWLGEYFGCTAAGELSDSEKFLTARAAQWGADEELEACLNWLTDRERFPVGHEAIDELRAARRPKPLSLKEQALDILRHVQNGWGLADIDIDTIRRALEQLDG